MTRFHEHYPQKHPQITVAIPAYNESQFVAMVISKAKEFADKVIVLDDGSTDGTAQVAKEAGAKVISHDINKGYGESIKSCFEKIKLNVGDVLVTLDGDAQHDPSYIPILVIPIFQGVADLTIASRLLDEASYIPTYRKFGIHVITFLYNFGTRQKITDAQSGFRAYSKEAVDSLTIHEKGMGASVELLIKAREQGLKIKEIPIPCIYHMASHSSHPITHGFNVVLTILKLRFRSWFHRLNK